MPPMKQARSSAVKPKAQPTRKAGSPPAGGLARARGMQTAKKAGDGNRKAPKMGPRPIRSGRTYTSAQGFSFDPGKAIGDFVAGVPGAINGAVSGLMGGQPGVVRRAMTKK